MSSKQDLEPLDNDLRSLLRAEQGVEAPPEVLKRSWKRVAASVALGGGGGGGHGSSSPPSTTAPLVQAMTTPASRIIGMVVASFLVGGVSGAALYAALESPSHRLATSSSVPEIRVEAPPTASVSTLALTPIASASTAVTVATPSTTALARPHSAPLVEGQLEQERAQLDVARNSLAQGDGVAAMVAVDRHEHSFSHPQLAEEREAIAVQALVLQHDYSGARARAAHFRATWPDSLFLPAIDASIGSIP